ncbi:39S ribosomal protein L11, mitochondrial [Gracilariopsis chorda]|uniref:Large ribosomal subunit protein uL11m n=1 Tax=Gracilariopsis chorda TaxID=448386 RepID=A0A2V3J139_9FLOR|nr:39S ribosomal protein L11, mitochondrial [Gracilariopsis chorda]|eukprot:PXF48132.1 39S ribosomal protein L11, mitochondrial [Gracilariopsis chorda]
MSRRVVKQVLKFTLPAGKAAPAPPVGPRLGQMGVNIMQFCKDFNAATAHYVDGTPLTTKVTAYTDRSASFKIRSPPVSYLLKKAAGVDKGANNPGNEVVGSVSLKHIYEIAVLKQKDHHLSHLSLEALCRCIMTTAKTCGIAVARATESQKALGTIVRPVPTNAQ